MKNIIIFVIIVMPFFTALSQTESTTFKIKIDQEMTTYQFSSTNHFEENFEKYLDDFESKEVKKRAKTLELFWVEISITIITEKETTTVIRSVNSSQTTIKEDVIKLKKQIFSLLSVL